jgi:two-component system KDP operon response regulator KdpE
MADHTAEHDMIRLLVVEDEPQIRRALVVNLSARGYEIETAASGEEALQRAAAHIPDGVILDLGVPGIHGEELVRRLRAWTVAPIVLLSERDQERDKVAAVDAGADDYVTKPFGMEELLARLRAALRGTASEDESRSAWVETPDFVLDLATRRAYAGGEEVPLTPTEWHLVGVLARYRGRLVPERRLLQEVCEVEPDCLRRSMAVIRGKLEGDPAHPRYFLAEPSLGYRLVAA